MLMDVCNRTLAIHPEHSDLHQRPAGCCKAHLAGTAQAVKSALVKPVWEHMTLHVAPMTVLGDLRQSALGAQDLLMLKTAAVCRLGSSVKELPLPNASGKLKRLKPSEAERLDGAGNCLRLDPRSFEQVVPGVCLLGGRLHHFMSNSN